MYNNPQKMQQSTTLYSEIGIMDKPTVPLINKSSNHADC